MSASETRRVYLDHNATTPVHPEVLEAMLPYYKEKFGNASSIHVFGREAKVAFGGVKREGGRIDPRFSPGDIFHQRGD